MTSTSEISNEIAAGQRYRFGENWKSYLNTVNNEKIEEARRSIVNLLGTDDLTGKRFLDIGCGSGLFSLAAKQMGATVHSFDYDPNSVDCARLLKQKFFANDSNWSIQEGSVLDENFMRSLGTFDIVYSWGVLHHTGDMKTALTNAMHPVSKQAGSTLCIAIYNDQDMVSGMWTRVKKIYNSGVLGKTAMSCLFVPYFWAQSIGVSLIRHKNPFTYARNYKKKRGMSLNHNLHDWLGGYPFEVAKPEEIFEFYQAYGYALEKMITTNRMGCNQFVFRTQKQSSAAAA